VVPLFSRVAASNALLAETGLHGLVPEVALGTLDGRLAARYSAKLYFLEAPVRDSCLRWTRHLAHPINTLCH
jgi:hypothetical protein